MDLQSVKSRFLGSYSLIVFLFVLQLPIVYLIVGSMSEKYSQIEEAGTLRKRAVEINYILNRHILNGEESLEGVFYDKIKEFEGVMTALKVGSKDLTALRNPEVLGKFETVKAKWGVMKSEMDIAMEGGDKLTVTIHEIEDTTYPMVNKFNDVVNSFVALRDSSYSKSINLAGLQRMRTVNLSYLMERYARSNYDLGEVLATINKTIDDFDETLTGLAAGSAKLGLKSVDDPALLAMLNDAESFWSKRKNLIKESIDAKDIFNEKITALNNIHTPELISVCNDLLATIADNAKANAMKGVLIMALSVLLSVIVSVFFMISANGQIIRPLLKIKETVEEFARGDLTRRAKVEVRFLGRRVKDEITSLGESVDAMADQMSDVIGRITDSSNHLASASEQLSTSSAQISEGAERQSSQTTQAATSMEEMSATVIEVAKNSQQANESARNAQKIATQGGDVVTQAIAAMKELAESTQVTAETIRNLGKSSEEIGTIVSVINDIADQTNLLALNAAIEAARAGEQGRGFAVVADEVRKLAERTTKATKEISTMIGAIQTETTRAVDAMGEGTKKVENGVNLANEAGESLRQIVMGVENVTDMISHIATSAEQQSATTDEITQSMDSIADVARSNVVTISQVAKATGELAQLANELQDVVSNFVINEASRADSGKVASITDFRRKETPSANYSDEVKKASGEA